MPHEQVLKDEKLHWVTLSALRGQNEVLLLNCSMTIRIIESLFRFKNAIFGETYVTTNITS